MKTPIKPTIAILILLTTVSPQLLAGETEPLTSIQASELILEFDPQTLNLPAQQVNQIHTYNKAAKKQNTDLLTTKLTLAKNSFKRITNLLHTKNQKLRASISKTGYSLLYTHTL